MSNNIKGTKYLADYPDGRYLGVVKLQSGFNENREKFRVSPCGKKIIHRTEKSSETYPDPMEDAAKILQRHGFDDDSVHIVALKHAIKQAKKEKSEDWTDVVIFDLDEECETYFVNEKGNQNKNKVRFSEDDDGTEWVYFWLVAKHRHPPQPLSDATLDRCKKRANRQDEELQQLVQKSEYEKRMLETQMKEMRDQLQMMQLHMKNNGMPQPDAAMSEY